MLDPVLVEVATMSPGVCGLCRTISGPFVDTKVTLIEGRLYVCVKTCANQIAALSSFVPDGELMELGAQLDDALEQLAERDAELEVERASKVVPLADVLALIAKKPKTKDAA